MQKQPKITTAKNNKMAKTKTCWRVMLMAVVLNYAIFSQPMTRSHRLTTFINFTIRWIYRQAQPNCNGYWL
jgi:hypothetical protein